MRQTLAWVIGALFIWAGAVKLLDPASFATAVAGFRLVPREVNNAVAIFLPPFEMLCGVALLATHWRCAGALGVAVLNIVFIVALAQGMARGLKFECGCFGKYDPLAHSPLLAIGRDLLLLGCAVWILQTRSRADSIAPA